ncbi:MAG TPA: 50S ribosomal protein L9 [Gemmatimonadales bacterium]|nr:50S ribosomal protein L9 [Gemmatimonadales bacterium]
MMEVILREDVKSLGKAGEMVRVRPGYARNFLLPKGLAYEASEGNKKRIAAETRARTTRIETERGEAQAFAARLAAATVTLTGKAGEEGKLFGSVTAQDIADGLAQQGIQVDRRRIELEHPIKLLGFHTVTVRLHPEVHAEVRVQVVAE